MTWSFADAGTLSSKDQVRVLIGDTDANDPLLSDESIASYLTGGSLAQRNVYLSAAACADAIAAKFARRVSMSAGGTSVQLQQQAEAFTKLAQTLRTRSVREAGVGAYFGGISRAAKAAQEANTDNIAPFFSRQMGDPSDDGVQPESLSGWDA